MATKPSVKASKEATPAIDVGTHFFNQLYLYAFATQGEIFSHIRTQTLEADSGRMSEILASWQAQQPAVQAILQAEIGVADRATIEELPREHERTLKEIAANDLFKQSFHALPISFALVEVDTLVAAQRAVNLDYVGRLRAAYEKKTDLADLIDICLSPTRDIAPIQHLEIANSTHVFSSPNLDIRFLGAFFKKLSQQDLQSAVLGGQPAAAVISFVGYGISCVNVLRWQNRLVLNNGFHRVYALRSLGVTKIPVVIQQVNNMQLEFPAAVAGLPREYLLHAPRPVLMKDFFHDNFCLPLKSKDRVKVVTLQTGISQFDAPA